MSQIMLLRTQIVRSHSLNTRFISSFTVRTDSVTKQLALKAKNIDKVIKDDKITPVEYFYHSSFGKLKEAKSDLRTEIDQFTKKYVGTDNLQKNKLNNGTRLVE